MDAANQAPALPGAEIHSLGELLRLQRVRMPGAIAFSSGEEQLNFARLDALSETLAQWLVHDLGLPAGTRVALQLSNRLAFPVLAMAVFKAALVLVNISVRASARERDAMLRDSGARVLFCRARGIPAVQVPAVVVHDADQAIEQARHGTRGRPPQQGMCSRDSLALLQYTGGSTGVLRAARLTHGNLLANLGQLQERLGAVYPPVGACMLAPLPFSHIYAFTLSLLGGIFHGHHTVLVADSGNPQALLATLQVRPCQGIFGIDSLYRRLCAHPGLRRLDCSALRIASVGGMPLSPDVARQWQQITGIPLTEGYGLTECSPLVACNAAGSSWPYSQGRALVRTEIRICDAMGKQLPPGKEGEVRVKGPQVMGGYWQQAAETARAFDADGWLRTGDTGVLDEAGYLYLRGRSKDMVVVAGFKVWPREVENCLLAHPAVRDACALGHGPAERQELVAFVVADAGPGADTLRGWCAELLAAYKVPRRIEFMSRLPRSPAGKLQRQRLQHLLADS